MEYRFWYEAFIDTERGPESKSGPRTVPGLTPDQISYQVPYRKNPDHVPYQKISYQKSVPRTKIRTVSDFRYGTVVHGAGVVRCSNK